MSTAPNLTLTVAHDTAGHYYCRASVPGFPDIGAEATVYMKGPPTIISHRTQYGIPGDNVRLECSAFSIPTPQRVVWSFRGEAVDSDLDYSVSISLILPITKHVHYSIYGFLWLIYSTVKLHYGEFINHFISKHACSLLNEHLQYYVPKIQKTVFD